MRNLLRVFGTVILGVFLLLVLRTSLVSKVKECALGCVTTHSYDDSRDNVNPAESILTPATLPSVKATSSGNLQGIVYGQPLYVSNLTINKVNHNVLFVATEENWVYALDGDNINNPPLWQTNLNNTGETAIPVSELPGGCTTIKPEVGVSGTPVIDLSQNQLFVVSSHYNTTTEGVTQRLNALDLNTGVASATALDIPTAFQTISFPFNASVQQQRPGLALVHNAAGDSLIYVAWGAYCDEGAYTGKMGVFEFSGSLSVLAGFDDENGVAGGQGGIWMGGVAPALTALSGGAPASVFVSTGNGGVVTGTQYGESVLRFGGSGATGPLELTGFYTPHAWNILNSSSGPKCTTPLQMPPPYASGTTVCSPGDWDLDSGGIIMARPSGSANTPPGEPYVLLAAGKEGVFYVIDPSKMNHKTADTKDPCGAYAIQCFAAIQVPLPCCKTGNYGNRGGSAFWAGNATYQENVLYVVGSQDTAIRAYQMNAGGRGTFNTALFASAPPPNPESGGLIPYPGASPVISWNSATGTPENAILWVLDNSGAGISKLFAYPAMPTTQGGTLSLIWSDTTHGPKPAKFNLPTVINGHIYVAGGASKTCVAGSCFGRVDSWH